MYKIIYLKVTVVLLVFCAVQVLGESDQWETAVSTSNPLNWYKLNETSGTVAYDYGIAQVNGTYGNGVDLGQEGLVGTGAYLGGTGTGVKVVYLNQEKVEGDWTGEFIVKVTTLPTESILLCQEMWGFIKLCQTMEFAGQVGYTLKGYYDAGLGYVLPVKEWHHLVFVMTEAEGMKLYVDGVFEGQSEEYLALLRQYLGGQETRDEMDGIVDEAVLYDRALTQDEIEAHADAAFGVVRPRAVVEPTQLEIAEPGSDSYTVVMSSEIKSDVTIVVDPNVCGEVVALSSGAQNPGYGQKLTLLFTPSDWDQEQTVEINTLDDDINLGFNNVIIKHQVSSSDPNVRDRAMDVSVKVTDDDSAECMEASFSDNFNDNIIDNMKWARVDVKTDVRGLTESYNILNTASGSYAMPVGDWPVFRMKGMACPYEGTMGMFIRSDGSAGSGVRLEFWAGGIGTEWQDNVLTIMSGDGAVTYASKAWEGENFDFTNTNFYWEVTDDGLMVTFVLEEVGNPSNTTTISAELPGVRQGRKILLGCDEWASSADCWYDDVCIFTDNVLVDETGIPAETAVFENTLSGPDTDSYTIRLAYAPDSPVTVTATVTDPNTEPGDVTKLVTIRELNNPDNSGYAIDVVLDAGNWQEGVEVEVISIDDDLTEGGPHIASIIHTVQSDDGDFDGNFAPAVDITIYDDDGPYILVNDGDGVIVTEYDTELTDSYLVQLLSEPDEEVLVTVIADTSQITVSAEEMIFTPEVWWQSQSITVSAIDDDLEGELAEGDPHITIITHKVSTEDVNYDEIEVDFTKVSILDNDCGSWEYNNMDFDKDCDVDLDDFVDFASEWMLCTMPYAEGCVRME